MDDVVTGEILRFALTAPTMSWTTEGVYSTTSEGHHQSKLLEGILFSRSFIIWYNVVLLGLLGVFTAWHWGHKIARKRQWRRAISGRIGHGSGTQSRKETEVTEEARDGASSSGSSTLGDDNPSSPKTDHKTIGDETSPLLPASRPYSTRSSSIRSTLKSWLMYQPAPLPYISKSPPSNLATLAVLLLFALNLLFALYRAIPTVPTAFIFADRVGLLFVANLPLLYLFAAKTSPLKSLTGHSYETVNIVHRRIGELLCLLAVLHAAGMIVVWYTTLRPAGIDFWALLRIKLIWLGVGAFGAYEALYLTSLGSFRQRFYELFLASHIVLQLAGLVFLWFHHSGSRVYVGIALGIFLVDRVIFRIFVKTRSAQADLTVLEDGETVLVAADWGLLHRRSIWSRMLGQEMSIRTGWKPTEHVFLTVPALAHKHIIQAHPFTIASAAPDANDEHAWLNLVIRARDGFSRDLLRYAHSHSSAVVRFDGPYGSLHALEMLHDSDVALVVAGGSGIAVAYPLIWSLLMDPHSEDDRRNKRRSVHLIWVVHDASHIDWIGQERLNELKEKGLQVTIPSPTRKAGRPDVGALVRDLIEEHCRDDAALRIGAVVSGPDGMNRAVRNTCAAMVKRGRKVNVSVEKFGW